MKANIIINPKNYDVCKIFLSKLSSNLIKNLEDKKRQYLFVDGSVFAIYHIAFEDAKTTKYKFKNSDIEYLRMDFDIEKRHLSNATQWISTLKSKDYKFLLDEMEIDYLNEDEVNEAMMELQFELNKKVINN